MKGGNVYQLPCFLVKGKILVRYTIHKELAVSCGKYLKWMWNVFKVLIEYNLRSYDFVSRILTSGLNNMIGKGHSDDLQSLKVSRLEFVNTCNWWEMARDKLGVLMRKN